jgi:hypothetical protein
MALATCGAEDMEVKNDLSKVAMVNRDGVGLLPSWPS